MAEEIEGVNPHPVDENPEECIGEELPDPWETADSNGNWKDVTGNGGDGA